MSAELLEWVDVNDLLTSTGARSLTRSGNEFTFSCFSEHHAHGDSSPSAGMNGKTSLWRCRNPACNLRGNAADYLAALRGYTRSEAMRLLEERYGGPGLATAPGELESEIERIRSSYEVNDEQRVRPTIDFYRDVYAFHWPAHPAAYGDLPDPVAYMFGRGFTPETLNDWEIGYDDRTDRITIPVLDASGELAGIKARAWREDVIPRYLALGHQLGDLMCYYPYHTYEKSHHVFALHNARDVRSVILCEGELNAIALWQVGVPSVAVAGAEFSERQRQLVTSTFDTVTIYFDQDAGGRAGAHKVAEALMPDMVVRVAADAECDAAQALRNSPHTTHDLARWLEQAIPARTYLQRLELSH